MLQKPTLPELLNNLPGVVVLVDKANKGYGNLCTCCGVIGDPGINGRYMIAHTDPSKVGKKVNMLEIPDAEHSLFIEWNDE